MTMARPLELFAQLCRQDLTAYVERAFRELNPGAEYLVSHHVRALCYALERVERGEIRRLLVAMPPRHLKSHCVSVAFTAWALGRDPTRRIVCASHGADLARTFSLQARRLVEAPWHRVIFPALALDTRKASAEEFRTTRNGVRIATSVGGSLTGKGGGIVIVDDPLKAEDAPSEARRAEVHAWFSGTMSSRLDDPGRGAMVVVAQRLHEDDLIGRLAQTGDWEFLELPAIAPDDAEIPLSRELHWSRSRGEPLHPERLGEQELERIRRELGSAAFEAQYQQRPAPPGGNLIKTEWFGTVPDDLRSSDYEAIVQSWDTAAVPGETNDWCVCLTLGLRGMHVDLLDVHRAQHLYPDLLKRAMGLRQRWKPHLILVEKAMSGLSLLQELRRKGVTEADGPRPQGDKVSRMSSQSAKIERGEVRIPRAAPWRGSFLSEIAAFPNGKHDDQVDALSQALKVLDRETRYLRGISRFRRR